LRTTIRIVGLVIAWIVAVSIIGIGIAYAAGFGLPRLLEPQTRGSWQVKGVRDIVCGVLLIITIFAAQAALWWLLLVLAITPPC
jgi:hypothetical protein